MSGKEEGAKAASPIPKETFQGLSPEELANLMQLSDDAISGMVLSKAPPDQLIKVYGLTATEAHGQTTQKLVIPKTIYILLPGRGSPSQATLANPSEFHLFASLCGGLLMKGDAVCSSFTQLVDHETYTIYVPRLSACLNRTNENQRYNSNRDTALEATAAEALRQHIDNDCKGGPSTILATSAIMKVGNFKSDEVEVGAVVLSAYALWFLEVKQSPSEYATALEQLKIRAERFVKCKGAIQFTAAGPHGHTSYLSRAEQLQLMAFGAAEQVKTAFMSETYSYDAGKACHAAGLLYLYNQGTTYLVDRAEYDVEA